MLWSYSLQVDPFCFLLCLCDLFWQGALMGYWHQRQWVYLLYHNTGLQVIVFWRSLLFSWIRHILCIICIVLREIVALTSNSLFETLLILWSVFLLEICHFNSFLDIKALNYNACLIIIMYTSLFQLYFGWPTKTIIQRNLVRW